MVPKFRSVKYWYIYNGHLVNTSQSSHYTDLRLGDTPTDTVTDQPERFIGGDGLRGISQLLSRITHRDRQISAPRLDSNPDPVLQLLQNQNLQESSDITRRRRMPDRNRLLTEPQIRAPRSSRRRGEQQRIRTVPFHSTHGSQISIGSDQGYQKQ